MVPAKSDTGQSEAELLSACRRGEAEAWELLVRRFQRLIYAIPRRAGLNEDLAAEVFQEVFTTLLEKIEVIEQPERLHAWLVTTARRKTWRALQREHAAPAGPDSEDEEERLRELPDGAPLAIEVMLQMEEQHRVRQALAALDERCRNLLTLLFYTTEPPAYTEVAARLGLPAGSIGPTRARCLGKLLKILGT